MSSDQKIPLTCGAVGALVGKDEESEEETDEIRLWEAGWKDRYYREKFQVPEGDQEFRRKVACAYVEGLSWMMRYYCQASLKCDWPCPSLSSTPPLLNICPFT